MLTAMNSKEKTFEKDLPAVTVRTLDEARRVVAAARRLDRPVLLLTEAGAEAWHGPGYLKAMMDHAGAVRAVLDCGDDPATAMLAIRLGWSEIHMTGPTETVERIAGMIVAVGGRFLDRLPESLDVGALGPVDEALERWIARFGEN